MEESRKEEREGVMEVIKMVMISRSVSHEADGFMAAAHSGKSQAKEKKKKLERR